MDIQEFIDIFKRDIAKAISNEDFFDNRADERTVLEAAVFGRPIKLQESKHGKAAQELVHRFNESIGQQPKILALIQAERKREEAQILLEEFEQLAKANLTSFAKGMLEQSLFPAKEAIFASRLFNL